MRLTALSAAAVLILTAACSPPEPASAPDPVPLAPEAPPPVEGAVDGLGFVDASGAEALRLACRAGPPALRITVPGFRPIGSEDRLTVGADGEAFAFVADLAAAPPGVTASGGIDPDLLDRLSRAGEIEAVYGQQQTGPLSPQPSAQLAAFVAGCRAVNED